MTTRAQVTFRAITGLPEDDFVNTFHFGSIAADPFAPATVSAALESFYNDVHDTQTHSLSSWMSEAVSRVSDAQIKLYDLNDPEPRVPYETVEFTPDGPHGASNLPNEVAMVISWKAAPVSGVPLGRLRGRTYIGPLVLDAASITVGAVRPTATIINDLVEAAEFLIGAANAELVIYSKTATPDIASTVIGGYVDNSLDTMRSRGPEATARTLLTP